MINESNIIVNKNYYDKLYVNYFERDFVRKLERDIELVFSKSQKKMLSMGAFYSGDFKSKVQGKKVLEIGAGNGLNACFMAHFGAIVTTQDISDESKRCISELSSYLNLTITPYSGDLRQLEFESDTFDFIVGKSILHHLTHELEEQYFLRIAQLLKASGEVRFVEPAHNRYFFRKLALLFPSKNRPSALSKKKYAAYKKNDPHPDRDNSAKHFSDVGKTYFKSVEILPYGVEKQLSRLCLGFIDNRMLTKLTRRLPKWVLLKLSKVQIIILKSPYR